jgi:hypothetical protein
MQAPKPKKPHTPEQIEVPDDVKAELAHPAAAATAQLAAARAVPIPEDVLADADAEVRAHTPVAGDDATIPAQFDEDD